MSSITDRDLATKWNVTLGVGRDWSRTIEFINESTGETFDVSADNVSAVVDLSTPTNLVVEQGDAPNKIVLSATSDMVGTQTRTTEWHIDVFGKRWFSGLWSVKRETVEGLMDDVFTVRVADATPLIATVRAAGDVGPQGPPGPPGIPGTSAGGAFRYTHVQELPAEIWIVEHGLNGYPAGIIVHDTSGNTIEGQCTERHDLR